MTTRKQIAQDLDRAAARVHVVEGTPASPKQCWYLAGLLSDRGLDANAVDCGCLNTGALLTSRKASFWIDEMLKTEAVSC